VRRRWGLILLATAGRIAAAAPEQPLPFSHKTHTAAAKLVCQDCHASPAKFGAEMGFPPVSRCMACHILIAKEKPAIRKLAEFAAAKQPIPWVRVYKLADFVFFDHRYHLMNQAQCEDCHGPVAEQDATDDVLGATRMIFCQGCHTKMKASGGCGTCHNTR
jgi:predicted CXXCH cytochrome family protein